MNRVEIRTAIQARGFGSDSAAVTWQNEAINSYYRRILGLRRWRWLPITASAITFTTTNEGEIALPANTQFVDDLELTGTDEAPLDYADPAEVQKLRAQYPNETGTPEQWTEYHGTILVYPRPSRDFTARVIGALSPARLDDDADEPLIPEEYQDLLVYGPIMDLAMRQRDGNLFQMARGEYNDVLGRMIASSGVRQRGESSHVGRSGTYDHYTT